MTGASSVVFNPCSSITRRRRTPVILITLPAMPWPLTRRRSGGRAVFGGLPPPLIEDVEFSHRLRKNGCRLVVDPRIQVRHIFNFSLLRSLQNALKNRFTGPSIPLEEQGPSRRLGRRFHGTESECPVVRSLPRLVFGVGCFGERPRSLRRPSGGRPEPVDEQTIAPRVFEAHGMLFGCLLPPRTTPWYIPAGRRGRPGRDAEIFQGQKTPFPLSEGAGRVRGNRDLLALSTYGLSALKRNPFSAPSSRPGAATRGVRPLLSRKE